MLCVSGLWIDAHPSIKQSDSGGARAHLSKPRVETGVVNRSQVVECSFAKWHQLDRRLIRDEKWLSMQETFIETESFDIGTTNYKKAFYLMTLANIFADCAPTHRTISANTRKSNHAGNKGDPSYQYCKDIP
jgi:hypothetical protein